MAEKVVIIELITFALTLLNELGMVEIYPHFLFHAWFSSTIISSLSHLFFSFEHGQWYGGQRPLQRGQDPDHYWTQIELLGDDGANQARFE